MATKSQLCRLSVEQLQRGRYQPRQQFNAEDLQELAESIKNLGGLLQPIVVRPIAQDRYEIIAGERRWRAAQLAGMTTVSCLVSEYSDEQALQAAIVENINRSDLNPIEEAQAYQRLYQEFCYTHEEIAATVGKSRVKITNAMRLLKLDAKVQALITKGDLAEGHGKLLAGVDERLQYSYAMQAIEKGWSVRALEKQIKKATQTQKQTKPVKDPNVAILEKELGDHLGAPVIIEYDENGKGSVKVDFHNIDILEGTLGRMGYKK